MTGRMTPRTFDWLLRLRGPALAAWPAPERGAALALLRRSAAARLALADALATLAAEGTCGQGPGGQGDEDEAALLRMRWSLDHAIAAQAAPARLAAGVRWGALAACAMLGAWLGAAQAGAAQSGTQAAQRDPLQILASLSLGTTLGAMQP
jgi:hypothetical protein